MSPSPKTSVAEVVKLTPAKAEQLLNVNTHNRPLRNRDVEKLRGAIERGEWQFNGDAIRFAKDGTLLDGQHRLWAISMAETGTPVEVLIIRDLEPESQLTMDAGARRTLADHLRLMGHMNGLSLAAAINTHWRLVNGLIRTTSYPTITQALGHFTEHPSIEDALFVSRSYHRRLRGSSAVIACLAYEFGSRDAEAAETFFEQIINGTNLTEDSPTLALRRYLELNNPDPTLLMALTIKAWNAYVQGTPMRMVSWRPVGKQAEAFPEIVSA